MNCKSTEGLIPITVENPSWSAPSRDWSEEVERASADAENDFNSSPQHHTVSDLTRRGDIKQKQTLRSSQTQSIVYNDLTHCAGIGRGKYKGKSTNSLTTERRIPDTGLLCNNTEMDSDIISPNSVEETLDSNSSCNSPYPEETCSSEILKESKKSPVFSNPGEDDTLSTPTHINGAFSLQDDIRTRNMQIPNIDHSRDYDYKKMANGVESFRGYRNKPSRMNRVPNNNANAMQYAKGFDNRTFGHRYPPPQPPMPLSVKSYRPVKPHENHYRHYDNRRHQQSSRPPFPMSIDKVAYAKHKGNLYSERDFLDVNRNFPSQNFSIPNELNRHISGPVSYVPQTNVGTYRAKHNSRLNCEKLVCNKNEPLTNPKNWNLIGVIPDSNTSTVSCHSRAVVTPMKTVVSRHCTVCPTPHEKHCPSLKEDSQQKRNYHNPCDTFNPNHNQNYNAIEMDLRPKLNNSPVYDVCNMRIPRDDNSATPSCERLSITDHTNSNHDYLPTSSVETKSHFVKNSSPDSSDPYLRDVNFPASHLRKDFPEKPTVSSPSVSSGNVPLPKQLSADYRSTDNSQVLTLHEDSFRSSPVSTVPHSSYADIIRMPVDTVSKVSSCQMANCMEITASKTNDYASNIEKINPKMEIDHASSEWILSRLSQIDINADLLNVNNVSHQVVNPPRPIAVNLEKPSFYNSKTGISSTMNVNIQPSNLSSPERKKLECQYVEEQLGAMLGYKKAGEKLSFLTELPPNLVGVDPSSICVPSNIRTDSTFSDTSSVCSSMSGTFKGEGHYPMLKSSTPPVIIMNNNYGTSEAVSEISFGIEMDEIIKLCGDSDLDSVGDSSMTVLSDSGFSSNKILDVAACEIEDEEEDAACLTKQNENYIVICNKKLLWKDTVDISKCNMPQIVGFLQESVGEGVTSAVKFYSEE